MKNRLYLVLGASLVVAVGALWAWVPARPTETNYEGKPLSYWLTLGMALRVTDDGGLEARYSMPSPNSRSSVQGVIHLDDTNAIPFLVRALKRDSWFGARYYREWLWPKLPPVMQARLPPPAPNSFVSYVRREDAALFLGSMGPLARPAVPALVNAANERGADDVLKMFAIWALSNIGTRDEATIAVLAKGLNLPAVELRVYAANRLRDLGEAGRDKDVLSALTNALKSPDQEVRIAATNALLKIDPEAAIKAGVQPYETMVPALITALKDGRAGERYDAAVALGQPAQRDERIISSLTAALSDQDPDVRGAAAQSLGLLGQADERVISALVATLRTDTDETVRSCAIAALGNLGRASGGVIPALTTASLDESWRVRHMATNALLKLHPKAAAEPGVKPPPP